MPWSTLITYKLYKHLMKSFNVLTGWQIDHSRRSSEAHTNPRENPPKAAKTEARQTPRRTQSHWFGSPGYKQGSIHGGSSSIWKWGSNQGFNNKIQFCFGRSTPFAVPNMDLLQRGVEHMRQGSTDKRVFPQETRAVHHCLPHLGEAPFGGHICPCFLPFQSFHLHDSSSCKLSMDYFLFLISTSSYLLLNVFDLVISSFSSCMHC